MTETTVSALYIILAALSLNAVWLSFARPSLQLARPVRILLFGGLTVAFTCLALGRAHVLVVHGQAPWLTRSGFCTTLPSTGG